MAESSAYFWSYDRNLIHWLVFDITGHPFLGTDAISANVMVGGHYHMLLSKVPEHVDNSHCPANCSSIVFCGIVLSFFQDCGSSFSWLLMAADFFGQI